MIDRGMVKWQPFNAVVSGNLMVNDVLKNKNKVRMPILSDDQKLEIQERIFTVYNNQDITKIKYFRDGRYYIREGKIVFIDILKQKIIMNGNFVVFFSQIIAIS